MTYQVTDIHGVTRLLPDHQRMVAIVEALYAVAPDAFEEVTLTHASGVGISLYANGSAVLDEPDSTNYAALHDLSQSDQLTLWVQLAAGNLKALRTLDWIAHGVHAE